MNLKNACLLCLACFLSPPLIAATQTVVGVAFTIESAHVFPDQTLGASKSQIESELSQLIAERLEFYFPFLDWQAGAASNDRILFKMTDKRTGLCDWQTDLELRAFRAGNEIELIDVPSTPLYDLCDPFTPNRQADEGDALNADDQAVLLATLRQAVENPGVSHGGPGGLLNNKSIRDELQRQFLRTIPVTQGFELRDQASGTGKFLYLPVSFDELKSFDTSCEDANDSCSRIRLRFKLPDNSPPATFTLRVAGNCGDLVLCEVLKGGVPGGFNISEPTFVVDDALRNLLEQAQGLSFTMENFTQNSQPCPILEP